MTKLKVKLAFYTASLVLKYLKGGLTIREGEELGTWRKKKSNNEQLFEDLTNPNYLDSEMARFNSTKSVDPWLKFQMKLEEIISRKKRHQNRRIWIKAAAAVMILGLASWQIWRFSIEKYEFTNAIKNPSGYNIQPGTFKAVLTLSDGTTLNLNENFDTTFFENGNQVNQAPGGTLRYEKVRDFSQSDKWNVLHIPNAGEYLLVLEDGTKVLLNASSTLRFPVGFGANERRVELLEGEAYFQVAKNKEKPFIVVADSMEIQAVGTEFNVENYLGIRNKIIATLTQGKVKVRSNHEECILNPGEQAVLQKVNSNLMSTKIAVVNADIELVTAWKNGLFKFKDAPLEEVMQQVSRWYNVKITYDQTFKEKKYFTGEFLRSVPIKKLLRMLELTGIARFRIDTDTIIVMPYSPGSATEKEK